MVARIIAVLACLALLPVIWAKPLRMGYQQWIAHQLAKVQRPELVVIGDSIAGAGGGFGRIDTINLASNGQDTRHITRTLPAAKAFRPRWIMANGGINDVIDGPIDAVKLHAYWHTLCAEPNLIAVLPTPTAGAEGNKLLEPVRAVILAECKRTLDLSELAGADGLLKPEYSQDGAHLSPAAYPVWRAKLHQVLR